MRKIAIELFVLKFIRESHWIRQTVVIFPLIILMLNLQCKKEKEEEPKAVYWPESLQGKLIGQIGDDIYTWDSHGLTQLTEMSYNHPKDAYYCYPEWSPDDSKFICTYAYPNENSPFYTWHWELCIINADGTEIHPLNIGGDDPCWSKDGTKITFFISSDTSDLYVMDSNGENDHFYKSIPLRGYGFDLSPDGNLVIFSGSYNGNEGIIQYNLAENSFTTLLRGWLGSPEFSPDGNKIVCTGREYNNFGADNLYVMNADGTDTIRLTNASFYPGARAPTWSPDGTMIAFIMHEEHSPELFVINADGSGLIRITKNSGPNIFAGLDWSNTIK